MSGLVGVEHGVVDVAQRVHVHEAGPDERVALVRIDVDGPGEGATDVDDPVTVVDDFAVLVDDVVASVVSDDEASPDPGPHEGQAFCRCVRQQMTQVACGLLDEPKLLRLVARVAQEVVRGGDLAPVGAGGVLAGQPEDLREFGFGQVGVCVEPRPGR